MTSRANNTRKITSIGDLRSIFGIQGAFSKDDLRTRFLRETQFDVELDILETSTTVCSDQIWQIEVQRSFTGSKVRMRRGNRGEWLTSPSEVPFELLEFVHADPRMRNEIRSLRGWKAWERCRWSNETFRRHRSKAGVLSFSMEIRGMNEFTGEHAYTVVLTPFGRDDEPSSPKISLQMPFNSDELWRATECIRKALANPMSFETA